MKTSDNLSLSTNSLIWDEITELANLVQSSDSYVYYVEEVRAIINKSLGRLTSTSNWEGVIRLRRMFEFLGGGETLRLGSEMTHLNEQAIQAAQKIGDNNAAGQFLHDKGQALHRQGNHIEAIKALQQSIEHYKRASNDFRGRESYFMTALCYRALGDRKLARQIIEQVLEETGEDLWRANPLSVMSWLEQDEGKLDQAETLLREAITLFEKLKGSNDVQVGQSLTDLAEVVGFQGRYAEANMIFQRAIDIFNEQLSVHSRQLARALLKKAEVELRQNNLSQAKEILRQADLTIAEAEYHDLMWRIQLAKAEVDLKQRDFVSFRRHIRLALKYRHAIGLTDWALIQQYLSRQRMGTGLPR